MRTLTSGGYDRNAHSKGGSRAASEDGVGKAGASVRRGAAISPPKRPAPPVSGSSFP